MKRKTINGNLFLRMISSGSNNLKNNQDYIDELNVFPVPDGDTGTNMSMTMLSGEEEVYKDKSASIGEVSKKLARGLLMGARGNSGVILSQLFRGLSMNLKNLDKANAQEFAKALAHGVKAAYKAVLEPVEGTILTVAREASEVLNKVVNKDMYIEELFDVYIKELEASLERTPDLLPVLKDAGVVDSGACGYISVIKGMRDLLLGNPVLLDTKSVNKALDISVENDYNIEFPYCTEFIVELNEESMEVSENEIVDKIIDLGDSLVCVKDEDIVKIHIHTKKPGDVMNLCQEYGEFLTLKIENMKNQHTEILKDQKTKKKTQEKREYGIISVLAGSGQRNAFRKVGCNLVIDGGQTMNPPTEEFVKAIKEVNAKHVIIIPNNSNVRLSAEQAAKLVRGTKVAVLPAKTISQGYSSLIMFDESSSFEENIEVMTDAIVNTKSGEITYAIRDTEINGVAIAKDDYIGILDGQIVKSTNDIKDTTYSLIKAMIDDDSEIITIFVGKDVTEDNLSNLQKHIDDNYDVEVEIILGKQDIYTYIIGVE